MADTRTEERPAEPVARQPAREPVRRATRGSGLGGEPDWRAMQACLDTWTRLRQGAG